jgi:hypothetical protein
MKNKDTVEQKTEKILFLLVMEEGSMTTKQDKDEKNVKRDNDIST